MDLDITILRNWLNKTSLNIYRDDENRIVIDGDVNIDFIYNNSHKYFPIKIHKVNGDITWSRNLYSLHNFPDIVNGNVNISRNPYLYSLDGCPKVITGRLQANNCGIDDISGIATEIGTGLNLANNPLENIEALYNVKFNCKYILLMNTIYAEQHFYDVLYHNNPKYSKINDVEILVYQEEDIPIRYIR